MLRAGAPLTIGAMIGAARPAPAGQEIATRHKVAQPLPAGHEVRAWRPFPRGHPIPGRHSAHSSHVARRNDLPADRQMPIRHPALRDHPIPVGHRALAGHLVPIRHHPLAGHRFPIRHLPGNHPLARRRVPAREGWEGDVDLGGGAVGGGEVEGAGGGGDGEGAVAGAETGDPMIQALGGDGYPASTTACRARGPGVRSAAHGT
ncbi:hypothetical protein GCM10023259_061980 [Thermocatellispora tengchongensis]